MSNQALATIGTAVGSFAGGLAPGLQQAALMDSRRMEMDKEREIRKKERAEDIARDDKHRQLAELARQEGLAREDQRFGLLRADQETAAARADIARLQQEDRLRNEASSRSLLASRGLDLEKERLDLTRSEAAAARQRQESQDREAAIAREVDITFRKQQMDEAKASRAEERNDRYAMLFLDANMKRGMAAAEAKQRADEMALATYFQDLAKDKEAERGFRTALSSPEGLNQLKQMGLTADQAIANMKSVSAAFDAAVGGASLGDLFLDQPDVVGPEMQRRNQEMQEINRRRGLGELTEDQAQEQRIKVASEPFPLGESPARSMLNRAQRISFERSPKGKEKMSKDRVKELAKTALSRGVPREVVGQITNAGIPQDQIRALEEAIRSLTPDFKKAGMLR